MRIGPAPRSCAASSSDQSNCASAALISTTTNGNVTSTWISSRLDRLSITPMRTKNMKTATPSTIFGITIGASRNDFSALPNGRR
jgi:hypothetical protein